MAKTKTKAKKSLANPQPARSGVALEAPVFSLLKRYRERVQKKEGARVSMSGAVARALKKAGA